MGKGVVWFVVEDIGEFLEVDFKGFGGVVVGFEVWGGVLLVLDFFLLVFEFSCLVFKEVGVGFLLVNVYIFF